MHSINSCRFFLSKCNPYFIMKFSDSTSFAVNSINGSPSPALTQIGLIRNAFVWCFDKFFKRTLSYLQYFTMDN